MVETPPPHPRPNSSVLCSMPGIMVILAWCFLQVDSRRAEVLTGHNNGNFLDSDKWLSTVSQYDRDKYWNRFRDSFCEREKGRLSELW
uniref:Uncharacterized protein n=1 Tax=Vombatus ursinus TaxID=29139 RepID=A0A4X2KN17_VOMUR